MIMNKEQETKFRELISQRWNRKSKKLTHSTFFKTLFEVMDFPIVATTIDEIVKLANDFLSNLKEVEYCTFNILSDLLGVKHI